MLYFRVASLLLLFSIFQLAHSQYTISGKIVDAATQETLAFANITFNNQPTKGTISDIDGKFSYTSEQPINLIEVSYLGYEKLRFQVTSQTTVILALEASDENLEEIIVSNAENPALRIIRLATKNRDQNNPLKKGGFQYTSYNRSIVDREGRQQKADSLRTLYLGQLEKGELNLENDSLNEYEKLIIKEGNFNIMLLESVTQRKFLPPDLSEENVIATRVSGFESPYFAMLATEIQPFGFYENTIDFLDLHFLNPIAPGSIKRYNYFLENEILRENDTLFQISFQPKKSANIDGLKGFMYIHSKGYAIQNIVAEPNDEMLVHLKIEQKYNLLENEQWFPEQLNFELMLNQGVFIHGKSYISDVKFLDSLRKRDFSEVQLKYEKEAPYRSEEFWNKYRIEKLSELDKNTYKVVDSIGKELKMEKVLDVASKIGEGYIPWGVFNIPFNRFFGYNKFEGIRLGAGLETNEKLIKNLQLGGYVAYGFRDKNWKYGGHIHYDLNRNQDMFLKLQYSQDVREIGQSSLPRNQGFSLNGDARSLIASEMDWVEQFQVEFSRRDFKYLKWNVALRNEQVQPQYDYLFIQNEGFVTDFTNTEAILHLRYAHRERIVETPFNRVSLGTSYPVFNLRYVRGLDSFLDGDFAFHKLEASINQQFFTKNFGKTKYRLQAGYLDGEVPLGLLFTGEGSKDNDFPVVMYDQFQTMLPYEFLSDQYVHVFLTHDIGSLLFKTKDVSPGIVLHHNMGWGDLTNSLAHSWNFQTLDKVFVESGIELTQLVKVNYLDAAYLGFGVGAFYRYGNYSLAKNSDNFALKINTTISFN